MERTSEWVKIGAYIINYPYHEFLKLYLMTETKIITLQM